jgi:hypothetical protein
MASEKEEKLLSPRREKGENTCLSTLVVIGCSFSDERARPLTLH